MMGVAGQKTLPNFTSLHGGAACVVTVSPLARNSTQLAHLLASRVTKACLPLVSNKMLLPS